MPVPSRARTAFLRRVVAWWKEEQTTNGFPRTLKLFLSTLWEFVRDSTPQRKKQRYGDADFDWDHRVNTTSAIVTNTTRFLGHLNSLYQPTDGAKFHEMLGRLQIDFSRFTFIDIGSGKGRVLLMASDYPFDRIIGVEMLPELHLAAQENLAKYRKPSQQCYSLETRCEDARDFVFPLDPLVVYLFNPLPKAGVIRVLEHLTRSLSESPRQVYVIYHNAEWAELFRRHPLFRRIAFDEQYVIYAAASQA